MRDNEKRMIGSYEVIYSVSAGHREILLCRDFNAPMDERYMCTYCSGSGFLTQYSGTMVSDNFAELFELFGKRIAEQAEKLCEEIDKPMKEGIDDTPVIQEGFAPIQGDDDLHGKVIVIRHDVLRPEYQRATRQYQLCTGGFGASPNSRGTACYCVNLYDGSSSRYERMDVLGIVPMEELPDWAEKGLKQVERQQASREER